MADESLDILAVALKIVYHTVGTTFLLLKFWGERKKSQPTQTSKDSKDNHPTTL